MQMGRMMERRREEVVIEGKEKKRGEKGWQEEYYIISFGLMGTMTFLGVKLLIFSLLKI